MAPSTKPLKLEVVIVGCGITGLSAAVACIQKGFNVRVLEASAEFAHASSRWNEKIARENTNTTR